jgi:hypothetical protein
MLRILPSSISHRAVSLMAGKNTNFTDMRAYRAPSLFQPHRARQAIRDAHEGKRPPLIGYYFGLSSVAYARAIAPMGFDMIWIDWEHSSCNVETMTTVKSSIRYKCICCIHY